MAGTGLGLDLELGAERCSSVDRVRLSIEGRPRLTTRSAARGSQPSGPAPLEMIRCTASGAKMELAITQRAMTPRDNNCITPQPVTPGAMGTPAALLEMLKNTPGVTRIESQLL